MAHSHAAARRQIVARQAAIFDDGDEPAIIGQHVNVVERRNDEGDFEFARQIGLPIKRVDELGVLVRQLQLHPFDPNLVIGARLGQEGVGNRFGLALHFIHQRAGGGVGAAMTLRLTSPQAASVVAMASLMPCMNLPRLPLVTP